MRGNFLGLVQHVDKVAVLEDVFNLPRGQKILHVLGQAAGNAPGEDASPGGPVRAFEGAGRAGGPEHRNGAGNLCERLLERIQPPFQYPDLAVRHDQVVGKRIQSIIQRLPLLEQLAGGKRHKDGRAACGKPPLNPDPKAYLSLLPTDLAT